MKKTVCLTCLFIFLIQFAYGQIRDERNVPVIIRKSELQKTDPDSAFSSRREPAEPVWKRTIYRELDLTISPNASLYYPLRPSDERQNLLTILFDALCSGSLPVYEYIDGYELYGERYRLNIRQLLNYLGLFYEVDDRKGVPDSFLVEKEEYPSTQVKALYVKENWLINPHTSDLRIEIEAICPLLTLEDELGAMRTPLFWVKYEELSPFLKKWKVMTSDFNNTWQYSMDEYFRKRFYKGTIVKTENRMNKTLRELYPDPDSLYMAQEAIEKQLESFKKSLSWSPDSVKAIEKEVKKEKEIAPKTSETPVNTKAKPAPVRSVRRR